jgi:polar amino acid transport system substrate-binding protein
MLLAGALLGLPAVAAMAGGLEDARRRGRLLAGVKTDFPPFGYRDAGGAIQGFDADLARYLGHALFEEAPGVELVPVTSGGRIPFLYSDFIDVIVATMTITEERQRVLEFSTPYFMAGSLLLTRAESPVQGVPDLGGQSVAVVEGSVQQKDLPLIAPDAVLLSFKSLDAALEALRDGRVEALCQDDLVILREAQQSDDVRPAGKIFLPRPYAMAVRKGDHRFLDWLNAQLEKMKADGTLEELRRRHLGALDAALRQYE